MNFSGRQKHKYFPSGIDENVTPVSGIWKIEANTQKQLMHQHPAAVFMSVPGAQRMWDTHLYLELSAQQQELHFIPKLHASFFCGLFSFHHLLMSPEAFIGVFYFGSNPSSSFTGCQTALKKDPFVILTVQWGHQDSLRGNGPSETLYAVDLLTTFFLPPETSSRNFWSLTEPDG